MTYKPITRQEIVAFRRILHHTTLDRPKWSGDPDEWPVCLCGKDIYIGGDTQNGPQWGCADSKCDYA